ncbi:carbon-nitrogen hydrolase family protein [Vibrio sp. TRT 17S01]|uniref:carbon-nitrogen hydrolase family protein n=1 Tax=Vibrio sp. TRT 17S01 TaxID=3418505 RepID=UPI003CF4A75D
MERVGIIQMTSGPDPQKNLMWIRQQVAELAAKGAKWVLTPENALVFGQTQDYHRHAEPLGHGELQQQLAQIAKEYNVWLLIGSMPIRRDNGVTTTLLVFNSNGQLVEHYDKLHMFDVDVADSHKRYRESDTFTAGNRIVVCDTPFATLGMSICYDVRFPPLYSELVRRGAQILLVPAAFTAVTGKAHWQTLLQARAIEAQCWVVAVNQTGTHPCGRETWGHSMVIDPWGRIVLQLGGSVESQVVDIDLKQVDEVRAAMPVDQHSRFQNQFQIRAEYDN